MKRLRKWIIRIIGVVGVVAAAALALYVTLLPRVARNVTVDLMASLGLATDAVEVRGVSLHELQLADVGDAAGWLHADAVGVSYDVASLRDQRVDRIEVVGAQWRIAVRDGKLDLGPLFQGPGSGGGAGGAVDLPFRRLELRASTLLVKQDGRIWRIPVEGAIDQGDRGAIQFDLTIAPADRSLRLGGQVRIDGGAKPGQPWQVDVLEAVLSLAPSDQPVSAAGLTLRGLTAQVRVAGTIGPQGVDLQLLQGTSASVASVAGPAAPTIAGKLEPGGAVAALAVLATRSDAARFTLSRDDTADAWRLALRGLGIQLPDLTIGGGEQPVKLGAIATGVEMTASMHGGNVEGSIAMTDPVALQLSGADWSASAKVSANAEATLTGDGGPVMRAVVQVDDGSMASSAAALSLAGVSAAVPIAFNGKSATPGRFKVDKITWRKDALPAMSGQIAVTDGRADLSAHWPLLQGATLDAAGSLALGAAGLNGELTAAIPQFKLNDSEALARMLSIARDARLDGTFALSGRLRVSDGRVDAAARIDVLDANVSDTNLDTEAKGVTGSISFDGFTPVRTPGNQQLAIQSVRMGKLILTDGTLAFRVESPQSILVERTRWHWGEQGLFYVHAFRFDPGKADIQAEVFVEEMNLGDWLNVLTDGKVQGQGRLYGRLPVHYRRTDHDELALGQGFLYVNPGKGRLKVYDSSVVSGLLQGAGPQADDTRQLIVRALKDFEYSRLTFDFIQSTEGLTMQVNLSGNGLLDKPPIPIGGLTVNVNGFDRLINAALLVPRGSSQAIDLQLDRILPR